MYLAILAMKNIENFLWKWLKILKFKFINNFNPFVQCLIKASTAAAWYQLEHIFC